MRFADFAVDLAAVIRASRSVGRHHVALRARQLDALSRSSSIPGLRKTRNDGPAAYYAAQETSADEEPLDEQTAAEQSTTSHTEANEAPLATDQVMHTPHASTMNQPATAESSSIRQGPAGSLFSQLQHKTEAVFPVSAPGDVHSPSRPTAVFPGSRQSPLNPAAAKTEENTIEYDDVPPGVDINVFRTPRGSKILGSLGKGKPQEKKPEVQYPAPWAALASSATGPRGPTAEVPHTAEEKPIAPPPETQQKPEAKAKANGATTQPLPNSEAIAQPNPLQGRAYTLRESKVPATRLSRLWNYSGLAAGMLGGALTESLSRAVGGGASGEGSVMLSGANMERLVAKLSRMRGAALKMGQMMSFQDAKMLPAPIREVLQRVQDRADYMPSYQRDKVLVANLGENWRELYAEFEETPIAAASIGQVHRATLKSNGKPVAVKIQFPGVADSINSDLDNLAILLTATKLLPKGLYLEKTIANARTELGWECDYAREAECLSRFGELMADETGVFLVPSVYTEASGKQVLTMDFMEGTAVTRIASFTQQQKDWIGTQILRLCLREITEFRFMQTDPNWTNFLYNESLGKLELLDFGASREYPAEFVDMYVRLLQAASRTDRALVKELSEELGYLTGHESKAMLDAHIGSILTLAEPFLESAPDVYDFQDQTITERVKGFIPVMLKERLAPPPEETYSLHRKLSGAFLLCARLGSRVPCKELFKKSLEKSGYVN